MGCTSLSHHFSAGCPARAGAASLSIPAPATPAHLAAPLRGVDRNRYTVDKFPVPRSGVDRNLTPAEAVYPALLERRGRIRSRQASPHRAAAARLQLDRALHSLGLRGAEPVKNHRRRPSMILQRQFPPPVGRPSCTLLAPLIAPQQPVGHLTCEGTVQLSRSRHRSIGWPKVRHSC